MAAADDFPCCILRPWSQKMPKEKRVTFPGKRPIREFTILAAPPTRSDRQSNSNQQTGRRPMRNNCVFGCYMTSWYERRCVTMGTLGGPTTTAPLSCALAAPLAVRALFKYLLSASSCPPRRFARAKEDKNRCNARRSGDQFILH